MVNPTATANLKAWPHNRENHKKLSDDFRELFSRYDQYSSNETHNK